jgi:hypothetical protein
MKAEDCISDRAFRFGFTSAKQAVVLPFGAGLILSNWFFVDALSLYV